MNAEFKRPAATDLRTLLAVVAGSTILSGPARRPEVPFTDWQNECKSADVDALVLAWIASFVPGPARHGRLH